MKCDEVRDQLPDHLLGALDDVHSAAIRRHLRGCGGCRRDLQDLGEGVDAVALAQQSSPPESLREHVMSVLQEEWAQGSAESSLVNGSVSSAQTELRANRGRPLAWIAGVAAALVLVASMAIAVSERTRASNLQAIAGRSRAEAVKLETFLGVLGGEDVRVGSLESTGSQSIDGSVVVYDSKENQSWVLALVQAPGLEGAAKVTLTTKDGHTLSLRGMTFGQGGEASTFLVTSSSLKDFNGAVLYGPAGEVLARAEIS